MVTPKNWEVEARELGLGFRKQNFPKLLQNGETRLIKEVCLSERIIVHARTQKEKA